MKIQVLMSVYNGEVYLEEQMESILGQDFLKNSENSIDILVRDDGSADTSIQILASYAERYQGEGAVHITYYRGENIGVIRSFFDLMQHAKGADYYALSDQDDFWMEDKLSAAVEGIEKIELPDGKPKLYCSKTALVNQNLEPLESEIKRPPYRPGFGNAVVENICTGCTALMNQALLDFCAAKTPSFTVMHDWWLYLSASALGGVYFDETPHILYRQHGGNEVGMKTSRIEECKMRLGRFKKTRGNISRQLYTWHKICKEQEKWDAVPRENKELLLMVLRAKKSIRYRMRMVRSKGIYRQRKMDDGIFRIIFLTGSF